MKRYTRTPRGYQGTACTSRAAKDLLPGLLTRMTAKQGMRPDLVLEGWTQVIGPQFSAMTKAVSFDNGILYVQVTNSSLYSLLVQHERSRLLRCLKERFPAAEIKNIVFRLR